MFLKAIKNLLVRFGNGAVKALTPSGQQQALGGRRVWLSAFLSILSMVFVIVASSLGLPANVILATLAVGGLTGGSFVIGESIRDISDTKQN